MTRLNVAAAGFAALTLTLTAAAHADHLAIEVEGASAGEGTLVFPSVRIDKDGFLVVHAMRDGSPVLPGSVGNVQVPAGTTENVSVPVEGLKAGDSYLVMLHYDTDGDGRYGFGEGSTDVDTPALNAEGKPYTKVFQTKM